MDSLWNAYVTWQELADLQFGKFHRKTPPAQVFSCEIYQIFKSTFFTEHLLWLVLMNYEKLYLWLLRNLYIKNKAKGRISKQVFQENEARQIFRKTNISYPLTGTFTCAYQVVRNVCFSENLTCFVFLKHPFRDSPFCFITDSYTLKNS